VDVHRSLRAAAQLLERSMDPSVELVLELDAARAVVDADATLLQNALLNLLVNARDAMPQGGRLVVATSSSAEHLDVSIQDTGIGIDDEALPRIFDPFFTTKPLGTGLGLAAVAGTAQSLGGTVSVESQLGHGSVFRMRLPLSVAALPPELEEPQRTVGRGEILIVDDQPLVLRTASAVLVRLGYDVVAVTSGRDAVELVRESPGRFDLVLLDLRMPGMSGEATFDALIHIEPSIRVLVWSGYGAEQDLPEMLRRGAVGFLPKPYGVVDLSNMVARVIRPAEQRPSPERARSE
jgi:CheY-like chemotaxis protein